MLVNQEFSSIPFQSSYDDETTNAYVLNAWQDFCSSSSNNIDVKLSLTDDTDNGEKYINIFPSFSKVTSTTTNRSATKQVPMEIISNAYINDKMMMTELPLLENRKRKLSSDSTYRQKRICTASDYDERDKNKFSSFDSEIPLAISEDEQCLIPLHCYVRSHIVSFFCTTIEDVNARKSQGMNIETGQVGICCRFCRSQLFPNHPNGSVYFPSSISSIYNGTMNLLQRHIGTCKTIPEDIRIQYNRLKSDKARSGYSKKYWMDSAKQLGLVDTDNGIRYAPSTKISQQVVPSYVLQNITSGNQERSSNKQLVISDDKAMTTDFLYTLMDQVEKCTFNESDRIGKRNLCQIGTPGLACKHCGSGCGLGRFFPSTFKTFCDTSKTVTSIHKHLMKCRECPEKTKIDIMSLKNLHTKQKSQLKFRQIRTFFLNVWSRLHDEDGDMKYSEDMKTWNIIKSSMKELGCAQSCPSQWRLYYENIKIIAEI